LNVETEELTLTYENYIKTINAVTAEDVLNAANKYFLIDNTQLYGKRGRCYSGVRKTKYYCFISINLAIHSETHLEIKAATLDYNKRLSISKSDERLLINP
jgi:hypothetical protein